MRTAVLIRSPFSRPRLAPNQNLQSRALGDLEVKFEDALIRQLSALRMSRRNYITELAGLSYLSNLDEFMNGVTGMAAFVARFNRATKDGMKQFNAELMHKLSPTHIANLLHPEWLGPAAVAALSVAQFGAINAYSHFADLDANWFESIATDTLGGIAGKTADLLILNALPANHVLFVPRFKPAQVAALGDTCWIAPGAVALLTAEQVKAIRPEQFDTLTVTWLQALKPLAIAALTTAQLAAIRLDRFRLMSREWFGLLNDDAVAGLDKERRDLVEAGRKG